MGFCKSFQLSPRSIGFSSGWNFGKKVGICPSLNNHDCTGAADVLKLIQSIIDLIYHSLCHLKAI